MIYCGIDVGIHGALGLLDEEARVIATYTLPHLGKLLDIVGVSTILRDAAPNYVILETQQPFPKQGAVSTGRLMREFGNLEAILQVMSIPHRLVRPQDWKRAILKGMPKGKEASVLYCQRRWPDQSLLPTERSRKPSDGIADALCMALLARNEAGE